MPKWYGGSTLNPDELTLPQEQWRGQWERVLRWFDQVQLVKQKALKEELDVRDMDVVVAFFQNCYHVRDWIKTSKPELEKQLNVFFQDHFEMGACRDICNGFKHKALANPTHDKDFNVYREYDYFEAMSNGENSPIRYRAVFATGSDVRKFDLFVLAQTCVDLWRRFFQDTGLKVNG